MYSAIRLLSKPFNRGDGLEIQFRTWENEIDPIFKLLAYQNIHHCSWITATEGFKVIEPHKISDVENEYIINWSSIKRVDKDASESWETHPGIIGFDIEAYSDNHRKFPDKHNPLHDAICISVIYARDGWKKDQRIRYLIVQGDINQIPKERFEGVITIRVKDQEQLVFWLANIVEKHETNAIITYNGLGFDYDYLNWRLLDFANTWPRIGKLKYVDTDVEAPKAWESGAYGINKDSIVKTPGIINLDMYKIVRRDFKLSEYKLGKVGLFFGLGTKDDINAEYMFRAYEVMKDALNDLGSKFPGQEIPLEAHIAYRIYKSFCMGDEAGFYEILNGIETRIAKLVASHDFMDKLRDAFNVAVANGFDHKAYEAAIESMTKVAVYCIQDVELCFDLYEHFKLWISSIETANIVGVNIVDLYSRGQQIRCMSQLYRAAFKKGIVMDQMPVVPIPFIGGKVIDPQIGMHDDVLVLDFKSLYPLIMIAYNICFTTLIPEELWHLIPTEWCNIVNVNCSENFDPSVDMMDVDEEDIEEIKKKGKQYCNGKKGNYEFRFIKSSVLPGLLPGLVEKLVNNRDKIVTMLNTMDKSVGRGLVLNKRQLGLKISANSFFGFLGVLKNGKRPLRQGAISITALGRESIQKVIDFLVEKYEAEIIYGDTDSCMVRLPKYIKKPEDCAYWMDRLSKEITDLFPKPMQMKPEYAARMLALMKKKYLMMPMLLPKNFRRDENGNLLPGGQFKLNKDGSFLIETKGTLSARRDNCQWARDVYDELCYKIMNKDPFIEVFDHLIDKLKEIMRGDVGYEQFIITRAVRDNYKSKTYFMKVFYDVLTNLGTPVEAGERLPYLVYVNPGAKNMGERMMLREKYLNDINEPNPPKIDYVYYIDKILTNPADQAISAAYRKEVDYLQNVKARKTERSKDVSMIEPVKLAVTYIKSERNLEELRRIVHAGMDCYNPDSYIPTYITQPRIVEEFSDRDLINIINMRRIETLEFNRRRDELYEQMGWSYSPVVSMDKTYAIF
jgi:DNA polymerase elongation subunit (family B)